MTTKPKILHVLEAFAGGTERHLLDLVAHVSGFEHVIAVPCFHQARSTSAAMDEARRLGAQVECVEMCRSRSVRLNVQAASALVSVIRRVQPDVVHGHSSIGGVLGRLATIGTSLPFVYTPHGLNRGTLPLAAERMLRARVSRFIAVSESEKQFAIDHGVTTERAAVVIPNGIDLEPPPPHDPPLRRMLGLGSDVPLVGSVARLAWQKAPEVFVAAAALVHQHRPDAHFVLIGRGPLRADVQQAIAYHKLGDCFHLVDGLPGAASTFHELDAYVLCSRYEGAPYTPLEAMRARVPVVVADAEGNRDTVDDRFTGLIVPRDDSEGLAGAISELLGDRQLCDRLVANATRRLNDRFDIRAMSAATGEVYRELILQHQQRSRPVQQAWRAVRPELTRPAPERIVLDEGSASVER